MSKIDMYIKAARPFSLTVSVFPPILGGLIAVSEVPGLHFKWLNFVLAILGSLLVHVGSNMFSDYFDYKNNVDRKETFGSSRMLVEGYMTPNQFLKSAFFCFGVALLIGVFFFLTLPNPLPLLLPIGVGAVLAVFYTFSPIALKYHGLGDIAVFIAFGSAMTAGAYFVQTGTFSWGSVLYVLPMAFLVDAILHANNLRDIEHDAVANIQTFAGVLGNNGAKFFYYFLISAAYISLVALVLLTELTPFVLVAFLSLPLGVKVMKMISQKGKIPTEKLAMADAATAQVHMAFSVLFIGAIAVQYFFFG